MSDLEPIATLLPASLLRRRRADPAAAAARAAWPQVVGEQVARHSLPIRMSGDTLVVHCSGSTWASELTLLAAHVRESLGAAMGDAAPARLRFEVGELPASAAAASEAAPAGPDPARAELAQRLAAGVSDDRLRDALAHAIGASPGTHS
jgi:predicted nucleic acid-binding Zn ribbon protein